MTSGIQVDKKCNYCGEESPHNLTCGQCKLNHYCNKDHQTKDWVNHKRWCNKSYRLGNTPDRKGLGLFATRNIKVGECIISDTALLIMPRLSTPQQVEKAASKLTEECKKMYYQLHNNKLIQPLDKFRATNIFMTNGLALGTDPTEAAVFPVVSRINHSCKPNVYHSWNTFLNEETVYAIRDIRENEEILTSYVIAYKTRKDRITELEKKFRFTCTCEVCSLKGQQLKESDDRRRELAELDKDTYDTLSRKRFNAAIRKVERRLLLLKQEQIDNLVLTYICEHDAFEACRGLKDKPGMRKWIEQAYQHCLLIEGSHSETAQKLESLIQTL